MQHRIRTLLQILLQLIKKCWNNQCLLHYQPINISQDLTNHRLNLSKYVCQVEKKNKMFTMFINFDKIFSVSKNRMMVLLFSKSIRQYCNYNKKQFQKNMLIKQPYLHIIYNKNKKSFGMHKKFELSTFKYLNLKMTGIR